MIPTSWTPVRRPADGELVGWLSPDGGPGRAVPRALTGAALGPSQESSAALDLLARIGLARLDGRWWCRLPDPLPPGMVRADEPAADWEWRAVVIVEVSPEECVVRPEFAAPGELRARARLPVPVGDLLREHPPVTGG